MKQNHAQESGTEARASVIIIIIIIIIIITVVLYSVPSRLPTQERSQSSLGQTEWSWG